ncbi:S phase cyclin A-associated protein in the endoplasmic reticulum-like isoform X2 [Bolinopsis microptera]|uniref:S phase cyclin A-associated protein in the endoplasmic reticulum-like isoform X2 n=1 Tax=Bolinopsis microptera TaxID=2820187 RepID=UPI003078FC9A
MSSSSVQSSMSLPLNPLARSTSWADLVRKGKSDSPVPVAPYKNPYSSKYQSTPSRYLNHRQAGTTSKYGPNSRNQPALSKSKSLPNQRGLQTNKIVRSKESHVNEDGWCISSGKSRIKTIPNSSKQVEPNTTAAKPSDVTKSSAMSPRLSRASAKSAGDSSSSTARSKASETKAKSSDGAEKTKSSRGIKPKPATTPSTKNVSAKVNSKPSGTKSATLTRASRPLTASSRGAAGKQTSNKRLVKTKSLESNTKLSDNLKIPDAGDIQKAISKSSETLETPSAKDKKDIRDDKEVVSEEKESVISSAPQEDTPDTSDLSSDANEASSSSNDKSEPLSVSEADDSSALVLESADDTDAESSKISSESKSIQTDASEHTFEDHVEIFAVPASSMYPKMEEEDNCNIYRVMISKRKRQISEQSSVSTDTLDDEDHSCLSPGRSPGRSPSSRSSGGGRSPGKAPQLHQRLSSPSRKRNTTDAVLKNYTERLAKAQVQRDKIQEEKANKLKKIKIKEEQIKDLQEQQEKERFARAISHAEKLARAEQLRDKKIAEVKRKAQEEDQKVNEIVFINTLEAQNRKMELLSKEQVAESKRLELQEERKRRSEELQAKEDAVQERKQAIEADRLARIAHIEDKIKESQAKVDLNKLGMETAAKEAAKERAFEREVTIELVKSDRNNNDRNSSTDNKPSKTKNRKETSKLKEMQQKAAMLCQHVSSEYLPTHTLYQPPKWCSKCNIKIVSEAVLMSHMIKRHQKSSQDEAEVESQHIVDYTDELCPMAQDVINRQKMLRKRSKKVKTRITNKISELPTVKLLEPPKDCPNKNRLYKCIKAMKNQKTQEKGLGDLSRTVLTKTDINHLIDKGVVEQLCTMLPERQHLASLSKLLLQSSLLSSTGSQICVRSLPDIVDCLHAHASVTTPAVYSDLLKLTSTLIRTLTPCDSLTSDLISYIVSKEIIEQIQRTCTDTYNYQLKDDNGCSVLLSSLQLLSACCIAMTTPNAAISISPTKNDPSQLVDSLVFTKACNIVTLLYGVLLYEGPRRAPPPLSDMKRCVVKQCLGTLLDISRFSLHTLQTVMDSEGMSLELRHVCSFVLSCASHHTYTDILDLCVQLIGFVVFSHPSNQALLQNGPSPSILQLLSSLPFSYFSDIRSMNLLFPSLISACHDCPSNLAILQLKVNKVMLISYLKEQLKSSKEKHINFYPRSVFQQALKFLETPDVEVT